MSRLHCTALVLVSLIACSPPPAPSTPPVAPADAGAVAEASPAVTASGTPDATNAGGGAAEAEGLTIATLVTGVRRWGAEGAVEEGEQLDAAPYDAAARAALVALRKCTIDGEEAAVVATISPSGEVRSLTEVKNTNECILAAIRPIVFPKRATDASAVIVVAKQSAPAP